MWGTNITQGDAREGVEANESEWQRAHRVLTRLARERAAADAEEARWLLVALRSGAHVRLGLGSFHEYVARLFGYSARFTQEKLRVAEALEQLPATARALEQGRLSWSAVRELTRVVTAQTEGEWLAAAGDKTVRQIEGLVAGAVPGDLPSSPRDPALRRRVLRFEVTAETYALFREAASQLRRQCDERLDDDALLLIMARAALQGPSDEGRSSYQVSLSLCPGCGGGALVGAGELVPVAPEVAAMAECDGQHIGTIERTANDAPPAAVDDAHVDDAHGDTHVGAPDIDAHVGTRPLPRAKQTIPPAQRRFVMQRDQHRCRVPGCCNATFVDVHHITARADGGANDVDNLLVLCGAHHRAVHRGGLVLEGARAAEVRFRHADGSIYGSAIGSTTSPAEIEVQATVFSALCNLGFRDAEVRRVLDALRREASGARVTVDALLRRALDRLTPRGEVYRN